MRPVIVILGCVLISDPAPRPQADDGLARLGWLSGCWELRRGARVIHEMWMVPSGDMMLGSSRTVVEGEVRDFEHMRLALRDGRLTFTALPSGQREVPFEGRRPTDSGFSVENPAHDFPQRIAYARRGPDSLVSSIAGDSPAGSRRVEFPMVRVRCEVG